MLLSLRNVEKSYPHGVGRTYVLRQINLDIKEGEFVSIMGPSGAGKSTLLQQLIGVARAVIAKPQVLLADEPTGNLHSAQGTEIMELFRTLNEAGATIVQVTHSEVNASYGSRIIQLRDGWVPGD